MNGVETEQNAMVWLWNPAAPNVNEQEESTNQSTTKSPNVNEDINESYKMAAQVAVGAAIIVALAILLALIWNSLRRRLPGTNNSGMSSSASRRRYSSDSFDRLVENRLRNRPPPYSPDQDKPPSYEESFHDSSTRQQPTPDSRSRNRRSQARHHESESSSARYPRVHETNIRNPVPIQSSDQETVRHETSPPSSSRTQVTGYSSNSTSALRVVSYDNQAFIADEQQEQSTVDIPSISLTVHQNELVSQVAIECGETNEDDFVTMFHL